ncbi:MAG TPA: VTT domain-containing protein [Candidatus Eremiobacteraceae bacterium]|nr:VTT domain-containing protein [Candidatus Eremiobacteraceae bacterium]
MTPLFKKLGNALLLFGPWGVFLLAVLQGAGVPIPAALDVAVAACVYQNPANAWLYVLLAAAGSALGCQVLYLIGDLGGEVLIAPRVSSANLQKIRRGFENHPVWTVALPAMAPPAFSCKISVLSAGAFEMRWLSFSSAIFGGRLVRFAALAVLTVIFGDQIVDLFSSFLRKHWMAVVIAATLAVAVVWSVRTFRRSAVVHQH